MALNSKPLFTLIDPLPERRRGIAELLLVLAKHVEQHENLESALRLWPTAGIVGVADIGTLVVDLQLAMRAVVPWRSHIVFGEAPTPARVADAIAGGASDYLPWPCAPDELSQRSLLWTSRSAVIGPRERKRRRARTLLARLSQRESKVLNLIAEGRTSAEIAGELGLSRKTVEVHRANLLRKLGVGGTICAVRLVIEAVA